MSRLEEGGYEFEYVTAKNNQNEKVAGNDEECADEVFRLFVSSISHQFLDPRIACQSAIEWEKGKAVASGECE